MLADRLKQLRLRDGLYQKDVADGVGISLYSICKYETGKKVPSLGVLTNLCKFFDVSSDYLLGLTDDPKRHNDRQAP